MNKIMVILYVLLVISHLAGCAYKGDVYLYSPKGDDIIISKTVSTDAKASLK